MEQPTTSSEKPSPKRVKVTAQKVDLIDLTDYANVSRITLKEGDQPFKVSMAFDPETKVLVIHFLES